MPDGIRSKAWNEAAKREPGVAFAAKLASRKPGKWSPDPEIRSYTDRVEIKVEVGKVIANVRTDSFGSAARNAVAAQTILGDVQHAMNVSHHTFEVVVLDSALRSGVQAALAAYLGDREGVHIERASLEGDPATRFVVRRGG